MQTTTPAYTARTTDYDRTVSTRSYTAAEADALIATALFAEDEVTPDADRSGRLTLTRVITGHRSALDTEPRTMRRTIRLDPVRPPRSLTVRQYEDLRLVHGSEGDARLDGERVAAGIASLPPAAAARLFERGWLAADRDGAVTVSYAGRVAMALHEHRTRTGYVGTDKWVTGALGDGEWQIGPGLYFSRCSCGHRGEHRYDAAEWAQRESRAHRLGHVRAALGLD